MAARGARQALALILRRRTDRLLAQALERLHSLHARKTTLLNAVEDIGAKSFRYIYDFGDGWEHVIKIERVAPAVAGLIYPRLIDATGRCPPEDVGGPWGYQEFLEALADPAHERHQELTEWWGGESFNPEFLDVASIAEALAKLARHWTRTPRGRSRQKGE